jgi:hypothetical protein
MGNGCGKVLNQVEHYEVADKSVAFTTTEGARSNPNQNPKVAGKIRRSIRQPTKGKMMWKSCESNLVGERQSSWAPGQEIHSIPFSDPRIQKVIVRCGI